MSEQLPRVSSPAVTSRNHLVDLARIGSVLIVVIAHTLLYQLSIDGGRVLITPWAPARIWWLISWFATIVPVFFVAAGFANAVIVDRATIQGATYAGYLVQRVRRILGPLSLYLAVSTVISTVPAWAGMLDEAVELSRRFAQLLWFLAIYLVILAVAPFAVRAHDRWGLLPMAPLLVAAIGVDWWSFAVDNHEVRWLNLVFIWLLAHQWGVAYHRGWFRGWPVWRNAVTMVIFVLLITWLIFGLGYPASAVGWADIPIANVQPPTIAIAALGLIQTCALGILERLGVARTLPPSVERFVATANALLFTVYLWHIPAILLAGSALSLLALAWPAAAGLLLSQVVFLGVVLAVVVILVPLIARVEFRLIPALGSAAPRLGQALVAFGVLLAGTVLVWQEGTVVHPSAGLSSVGVLLLALGIWLTTKAANPRPQPAG